ncbi:MAG TPA: type IV pilus assembly protein PilM [Actinomycetota bacterium]|nr:type IV pilus assembly protein PilM [Actinomycetota bacterium]
MPLRSGGSIGLDIGTSAVRAARVVSSKNGHSLAAFGQVALPTGAVTDGEIRDPGAVSEAIAQLWKRARLGSKKAVIGVANQRVVVRQVELPYLDEAEFRKSLRFQVADHIPMPVEAAELDFQILDDFVADNEDHMMRVLLVAAATEMIETFVGVTADAGVRPDGVDLAPFAAARAVSPAARGETGIAGAEAVVDVGAGITNIIVHNNAEPRFVRILPLGGDDPTEALAEHLGISLDEAEALKLDLGRGVGSAESQRVLRARVANLVEEIRGSLDYYSSQEDSEPIASVILTGGGSLTPGLLEQLEETLRIEVQRAAPLAELDVSRSGLAEEQLSQIEPVIATAVGLATGDGSK